MAELETATSLVDNLPQDIDELESARASVLSDPTFYRKFEETFYGSVSGAEARPELRLREGIGRFLLGQDERAAEALQGVEGATAAYVRARVAHGRGFWNQARAELDRAVQAGATSPRIRLLRAECAAQSGDEETLAAELAALQSDAPEAADVPYLTGLLEEVRGNYAEAAQQFQQALSIDPDHSGSLFRLAYAESLRGETETAIELYERLCNARPVPTGALINLGILFEDEEDYQLAANCFSRVLDFDPNNVRARMYYQDAMASTRMFYDEEKERKEDKRAQVLRIPVTDFELSVRSRNCLANMNVRTLGDLIRLSEPELLAFKNFGETSLMEIKNILTQKGLRLGTLPREENGSTLREPPMDAESALARSVTELDLSVRSRKALDVLGIRTIGELVATTEARLLACKNFGQTSLAEIKKKLSDLGLALKS